MKQLHFFFILVFVFLTTINTIGQTVTDIDGNVYNTVAIGTQKWIVENLKTTKLNDGTAIPLQTDAIKWNNSSVPNYCWYNNDASAYSSYGILYNWFTVNTGKLCPTGWLVPSDKDWTALNDYLGGSNVAGGKLKATTLWNAPNTGATNEVGFSALPGGYRGSNGTFEDIGNMGMWWSASGTGFPFDSWLRGMNYNNSNFDRGTLAKSYGFSIRCIKDNTVGIQDNKEPKFEVKIYPNPSHGNVLIECNKSKEFSLKVIDIYGEIVLEKQIYGSTEIELQSKGLYIVSLSNEADSIARKIVIQ